MEGRYLSYFYRSSVYLKKMNPLCYYCLTFVVFFQTSAFQAGMGEEEAEEM